MPTAQRNLRIKSLVTCLSAALAVAGVAPPAQAGSLPQPSWLNYPLGLRPTHRFGVKMPSPAPSAIRNVLSCFDDGSIGTLRQVIGIAGDNDYIDLNAAAVSRVKLPPDFPTSAPTNVNCSTTRFSPMGWNSQPLL